MKKRKMLVAFFILVAAGLAAFIFLSMNTGIDVVDQDYIKEHTGHTGFVLVDAREAPVFNGKSPMPGVPGGHIPGAINFPTSELRFRAAAAALAQAGITKDRTVILYCNMGILSGKFAETLVRDFHFSRSRIRHYKGGVRDWIGNRDNVLLPENHEPAQPTDDPSF